MEHTKEPWRDQKYIERFWSRVDVKEEDDCWEWKRGATVQGYGCFHFGHSSIRAHRFSYQQHKGKISEHDCVLHSCDNPRCVNPKHLWTGTRAENNADKESKKRGVHPVQSSGEANTNAVLTTPEVIAIKVMVRKGLPQARVAKLLGVSTATVFFIVNGERRADETERRISACVNACAGITTDYLEMIVREGSTINDEMMQRIQNKIAADRACANAEKQRDDLLAALELVVKCCDEPRSRDNSEHDGTTALEAARSAIASAKGK